MTIVNCLTIETALMTESHLDVASIWFSLPFLSVTVNQDLLPATSNLTDTTGLDEMVYLEEHSKSST